MGGCVPLYGGVVLVTTRMNRILDYDLENFTVTVQPGVLLQQLAEDALSHGCLYPPPTRERNWPPWGKCLHQRQRYAWG